MILISFTLALCIALFGLAVMALAFYDNNYIDEEEDQYWIFIMGLRSRIREANRNIGR